MVHSINFNHHFIRAILSTTFLFYIFIRPYRLYSYASIHQGPLSTSILQNKNQPLAQVISKHNSTYYQRPTVLLIDVDNTLYNEELLRKNGLRGIEEQIVTNIHRFGARYFNLTVDALEDMHQRHGSTVEGLRDAMIRRGDSEEAIQLILDQFYQQVYQDIDVSSLLQIFSNHGINTGYDHNQRRRTMSSIASQLAALNVPIYLVSNSPQFHVLRIISALGLAAVPFHGICTPDSMPKNHFTPFPTKHHPHIFYHDILEKYPMHRAVLLDDSIFNLQQAFKLGIEGILVNHHLSLEEALAVYMDHILPPQPKGDDKDMNTDEISSSNQYYTFDDVQYIRHKNIVDEESFNAEVWNTLGSELAALLKANNDTTALCIHDLGAGLLSMLQQVVFGGQRVDSLVSTLIRQESLQMLRYTAYESNEKLLKSNVQRLYDWGFDMLYQENNTITFFRGKDATVSIDIELILKVMDFRSDDITTHRPHLIIGCCFADLLLPQELVASVLRLISSSAETKSRKVLVYLPITFSGSTQFVPAMPYESCAEDIIGCVMIPSDTLAFQIYRDHLENDNGHSTNIFSLIDEFERFGAEVKCIGDSTWHVHPEKNSYLWQTLLYFFGISAAPDILKRGWNSRGWIKRAREHKPTIHVLNKDLLLSVNNVHLINKNDIHEQRKIECDELWFVGPRSVQKVRNEQYMSDLKPGHVEVRSVYSLISSGTELKIYKGLFEEASLDVSIEALKDMTLKYPVRYGYSLVGVVTRCAPDVKDSSRLLGQYVFTFSPHCSLTEVHRKNIHTVPPGVRAADAIFFPSVETALSIVHDAQLNDGETVAIIGQGLIGLLVNAILSRRISLKHSLKNADVFNSVTVFDTCTDRLLVASAMGADQCLHPSEASRAGSFDVCIEVSGNPRALQTAIDQAKAGGRVVIGSWYGDIPVNLKLGLDFHRSHKIIVASQVSSIPAKMSAVWSKERRFQLAWELLEQLKPSRLITKIVDLDHAQDAYERLDKGNEISIAFKY